MILGSWFSFLNCNLVGVCMLSWIRGFFEHLKLLWGKVPSDDKDKIIDSVVDAAAEMLKQFYRASKAESADAEKSNG